MKNISNRIVWIFREPRSGSTTAASIIAKSLKREWYFIDQEFKEPEIFHLTEIPKFYQKEGDTNKLFHTHYFPALHSMKNYDDPILIRLSRKDVFQQCLSRIACDLMNWKFTNIRPDSYQLPDNKDIFEEFCKSKIEVRREHVDFFIRRRIQQNTLWQSIASRYENQTIYYEDLTKNVDIPVLGLYDICLNGETVKLPDYKKEVFTNYDTVNEWVSEYKL
jgi:hypothetical protein